MVSHSSILAWKIPLTEEYGRLYSPWGHKRVGHDLAITQQFSHIILEFACLEVLSSNLNWELQLNSDTNHPELGQIPQVKRLHSRIPSHQMPHTLLTDSLQIWGLPLPFQVEYFTTRLTLFKESSILTVIL